MRSAGRMEYHAMFRQELWRWMCLVLFQRRLMMMMMQYKGRLSSKVPKLLCTCKLGGLLAATVTTPALSCMSANGTGQVAQ